MPLSPDASLFLPYTVNLIPADPPRYSVWQKNGEEVIWVSSVSWPTQEEAERHAHDLNYLREKTLESMTTTNLWLSIDIVSDGPDALVILEKALGSDQRIAGWRTLNPAADGDNDAWTSARTSVLNAIESIAQEDLPFVDLIALPEHLAVGHDIDINNEEKYGSQPDEWWVKHHRELHDRGFDNATHTHEWNDEEVDNDASSDEEEGAHEDADS